jgi:CRISPR system Cascade subunit CasE
MEVRVYAHKIILDQISALRLGITDEYGLHKLVYSLFTKVRSNEEITQGKSSGIQWVTKEVIGQGYEIIAVSDRPINPHPNLTIKSLTIPDHFFDFSRYKLSMVINPTYMKNDSSRKICAYTKSEDIKQWFFRKIQNSGFSADHLHIELIQTSSFKKNGRYMKLVKATIVGEIQITDKALFLETYKKGIGRSRSFGCGLMQISPIQ